ncbi:hypothetical protein N7510_003136 [Penicillium lagena]|uniref:uncharacterized protein n=1 Tax=Penicillium lagena TaxID=94218 RepID=UPI00253F7101|nr:uncharacterized protein N7510_003136 [Penicillium lagena]KAJ5619152.1 hypothetical protein N7510_003136 [Penicillium lagena]
MSAHLTPVVRSDGPYGQIVLFGDSITEHAFGAGSGFSYGGAMAHVFRRRLDVINRGFGGYNTEHGLIALPIFMPTPAQAKVELLVSGPIDLVEAQLTSSKIVCFGANDSCLPHDPTGHHVPLEAYCENLTAMITCAEVKAHLPRILLVTPPPIDEYQRVLADQSKGYFQIRRTATNTRKYAQACKETASRLNVPTVDIWTSFLKHAGWAEGLVLPGSRDVTPNETLQNLFYDGGHVRYDSWSLTDTLIGLHLSPEGYKLVFDEVLNAIKANYPDLDPDKMEYVFPTWEEAPKRQG